ncbi:hypothetical protein RJ639_035808 [Escallonia herrerae]|uniref:Reverse transcriptase/retrotransposon-derived protein RNase H-like domain-containing protein n=1 Tax=Escallonia herrerae TaxID=1293975 RepID=A0AA88WYW7_9ASTE|nr:hypothetical protein RJ639_035808 [Escallonia herrerae]
MPPLLSKPLVGEELFLYLAIAELAINTVLVREQDGKQLPIYYVSKVLQGAELQYPDAEKLAFALLIACSLSIEDKEQPPQKERPFTWTLHVDGSSNANESGAGLIFNGPENLVVERDNEALRSNLDLLNKQREQTQIRPTAYQQRVARYHDRCIWPRAFRVGDHVLRRVKASAPLMP